MNKKLDEIIDKFDLGEAAVFFAPRIPINKLVNALKTYAPMAEASDVIVLLDETLFGQAKEGVVLSKDGLFGHEIFTDPVYIRLSDIKSLETNGKDIYINKKSWFSCSMLSKAQVAVFGKLLNELIACLLAESLAPETDSRPFPEKTMAARGPQEPPAAGPINDSASSVSVPNESRAAQVEPEAGEAPARPADVKASLRKIFEQYDFGDSKLYLAPRIPKDKLANAIRAYAPKMSPEEVYLLLDDTIFGKADDGLLLGRAGLAAHAIFGGLEFIKLEHIREIEARGAVCCVNSDKFYDAVQFSSKYIPDLCAMLMEMVEVLRGNAASPGSAKMAEFEGEEATPGETDPLKRKKANEFKIAKELLVQNSYFFAGMLIWLSKNCDKDYFPNFLHKFDSFWRRNSTKKFYVNAWAKNFELELDEKMMNVAFQLAQALVQQAFLFSKLLIGESDKYSIVSFLAVRDDVILELLFYIMFKGGIYIKECFSENPENVGVLIYFLVLKERILEPYYQFDGGKTKSPGTRSIADKMDSEELWELRISNRKKTYAMMRGKARRYLRDQIGGALEPFNILPTHLWDGEKSLDGDSANFLDIFSSKVETITEFIQSEAGEAFIEKLDSNIIKIIDITSDNISPPRGRRLPEY